MHLFYFLLRGAIYFNPGRVFIVPWRFFIPRLRTLCYTGVFLFNNPHTSPSSTTIDEAGSLTCIDLLALISPHLCYARCTISVLRVFLFPGLSLSLLPSPSLFCLIWIPGDSPRLFWNSFSDLLLQRSLLLYPPLPALFTLEFEELSGLSWLRLNPRETRSDLFP